MRTFAHFAAGHVSLCFAYSLTPWLMVAEVRAEKDNRWQWTLVTGVFLGMIILADVRWVLSDKSQVSRSKSQDPSLKIQVPRSKIRNPKSKILSAEC